MSQAAPLTAGRFYSGVVARTHRPEFVLSELVQATPQKFPTHHHERDYFFLVLAGEYREGTSRKEHKFAPISAGYNPKHVEHAGEAGTHGVRFFTMEFADDFVRAHSRPLPRDPVVDYGARDIVWAGLRLFQCFRQSDTPDPLSFESLACELLGAAHAREEYLADTAPHWLCRAFARIEAALDTTCSISELAREAGVHPVHLARVFRKVTGVSPGEYLQRRRADRACHLLLNSKLPLSEVAAACGFYDQSHMTHMLRRYAHTTPKALRALSHVEM
jgi:AraC family transcriptional regulator